MKFMDILLNQKIFSVMYNISITNLLKEVDVDSKYIAIEVNGEIIPKSEYDDYLLKNNDRVEIITAVGGG
tara:strand:- start:65 stop:274 length:210 start_codon:yes stop_codon:yes gene_type:complete